MKADKCQDVYPVPFFKTGYNHDRKAVSVASALYCLDPSRARQEFKEETDINTIVERFGLTGTVPVGAKLPEYADFEGILDFQTALHAVMDAEAAFMEFPAEIRRRFNNNPQEFLEFCSDAGNLPELRELGLANPAPADTPPAAPPAA